MFKTLLIFLLVCISIAGAQAQCAAPPSLSFTSYGSECVGTSYTYRVTGGTTGTTYTWSVLPNTGLTFTPNGPQAEAIWAQQGTYAVSVYGTNECGTGSTITQTLNIGPITQAPGIIHGPDGPCTYVAQTFYIDPVPNVSAYWWTSTGPYSTIQDQGTARPRITFTIPGTYTITVTARTGSCTPPAQTLVVNVAANSTLIQPPSISGSSSSCKDAAIVLGGTGYNATSFNWNSLTTAVVGNVVNDPPTNVPVPGTTVSHATIQTPGLGNQTITLNYTTLAGCTSPTVSKGVYVNGPDYPVIYGNQSVCGNVTSVPYSTINGNSNYVWEVPTGGTIVSGQGTSSISVLWNSGGNHSIKVKYTSGTGCESIPATLPVSVNALTPTSEIQGGDGCQDTGGSIYYVDAVNPGSNYYWYIYGGTITSGNTTNSITVQWGAAGAGIVRVMESYGGCGTNGPVKEKNVTIHQTPSMSAIYGSSNYCAGATNAPYHLYNVGPNDILIWTVTGGVITSGQGTNSITVDWGVAGNGNVNVVQSNGYCQKSADRPVPLKAIPVIETVTGGTIFCAGEIGVYEITPESNAYYNWYQDGVLISEHLLITKMNIQWTAPGLHEVKVTKGVLNGCMSEPFILPVTVNEVPIPSSITGSYYGCSGGTSNFSVDDHPGNTYTWAVQKGSVVSGQGTSSIVVQWDVVESAEPTTITVSENNGNCQGRSIALSGQYFVYPPPAEFSIDGLELICAGATTVYTRVGGENGDTLTWTVIGGTITSGQNTNSVTVVWGSAGNGEIKLTQISGMGCSSQEKTKQVTVGPYPTTVAISGLTTVPRASHANYSVANTIGSTYEWISSGAEIVSGQGTSSAIVYWPANDGLHSISVKETSAAGCEGELLTLLVDVEDIQFTVYGAAAFCQGGSTEFNVTVSSGVSILWSTGSISSTQTFTTPGVYWVSGTKADGTLIGYETIVISEITSSSGTFIQPSAPCFQYHPGPFITLSAGVTGDSYLWSTGETSSSINPSSSGNYFVDITLTSGTVTRGCIDIPICSSAGSQGRQASIDESPTLFQEIKEGNELINSYPNPADKRYTVVLPTATEQDRHFSVIDMFGRKQIQSFISKGYLEKEISTDGLADGVYFLRLQGRSPIKFVVRH